MKHLFLGFLSVAPLLTALFPRTKSSFPRQLALSQGDSAPPRSAAAGLLAHLRASDILLDLDVADRAQLFAAIGRYLAEAHGLHQDCVTSALQRREQIGSTALGHGVAIPCARIKESSVVHVLYVRLRRPIEFAAPDGRPVSEAFVLLVPKQATEAHLHLLSEATQVFADQRLRERLRLCCNAGEIIRSLAQWRQPSRISPPAGR
ncbi:PTS sugar transporter subunit IIA [Rhodocyclus tenuis]|uniref:PTS system nitrogen regulatory IIA component n=1 Tax=Rhodocyclus tenuis TaxID=1066 RepID=A0A840GA00_RHOTE|nr:PTS sugar transporter subunit IIA [Rhodocyclus tenuis]MBB4247498.1 PTS system nitrogen regulatory IIA component [Rhodocyclus tenuis]